MIKKRNIIIAVIILVVFVLFKAEIVPAQFYDQYQSYTPVNSSVQSYPLPFLLLSEATPALVTAKAEYFNELNISGFIFSGLPSNWYNYEEELREYFHDCQLANKKFAHNFLKINIAEGDLPAWSDTAGWQKVCSNLSAVARFARESGFKGLVLDTTAYNKAVWNPAYYTVKNSISDELARKVIYQRGRALAQAIYQEFSKGDIIFTPIGVLTEKKENALYDRYYHWPHFVKGFLSVEVEKINHYFFTEKTWSLLAADDFSNLQEQFVAGISPFSAYQADRQKKGGLVYALFPLGRSEYDRGALLKPAVFQQQLLLAQKYSTGYVLICSQGQSWWQFADGEEYGLDKKQAQLPVAADFAEYQAALTFFRDPYLAAYFYEQKTGQRKKLGQFYFKRILDILRK